MGWITFVGRESQEQTVKLVVITAPRVGEVDKDIPKEDKNINWVSGRSWKTMYLYALYTIPRLNSRVIRSEATLFPTPVLDSDALPLLGSTYNLSLEDGVPSSVAILVSGLSSTGSAGVPLPGAPGCDCDAFFQQTEICTVEQTFS